MKFHQLCVPFIVLSLDKQVFLPVSMEVDIDGVCHKEIEPVLSSTQLVRQKTVLFKMFIPHLGPIRLYSKLSWGLIGANSVESSKSDHMLKSNNQKTSRFNINLHLRFKNLLGPTQEHGFEIIYLV